MRGLFVLLGAFGVILVGGPAFAEGQLLNLWPSQRATYQVNMDARAAEYEARGQAYVDHLYATQGEEEMPPADNLHMDEAGSADQVVEPKDVDMNEVQSIVSRQTSRQ
ncbi:MAG TPA: hypothetical protein PKI93_01920 [Alphaproteobacteria bacterium]|nr:hypothetical protein [Alphaproteobacteria bacterium]HNS43940.1 hypothetical protein [Alphaproteobacteria bacterium]